MLDIAKSIIKLGVSLTKQGNKMKKQELRFTGVNENADTHIQLHIVKVDSGDGNQRAVAVYTDSAEAEKHAKSIRKTTGFDAWSLYAEVQYKD